MTLPHKLTDAQPEFLGRSVFAVIMAGGAGTRFWPASRRQLPKQFLSLEGGASLLVHTVRRLRGLVSDERVLVVTAADYVGKVRAALPELPAENILGEPLGRNTAPCIAWASEEIHRRDPRSLQIALPADHVIHPTESFQGTLRTALLEAAREPCLVVLGIRPTHPSTGFGYIQAAPGELGAGAPHVQQVLRFVEKPNAERARSFLDQGGFFWNAGIFVWSTESIRSAFADHAPEIQLGIRRLGEGAGLAEVYASLPSVPVDIAILERASNVRMVPVDYAWNDVGSWTALAEILRGDERGNVSAGGTELVTVDAENCIAFGLEGHLTALVGVRDLVVVQAGNATLVCPRERAQDVRKIVERLEQAPRGERFL